MLNNINAVIFDLDGTLVDSMWMWKKIDEEYLGAFQIPLPVTLQQEIEGMSFSETAAYFKERFQLKDSVEVIKDAWNEMAFEKYQNHVPLKEGVIDFLDACEQRGIKLGIATSNSTHLAETVLKKHGIYKRFGAITTGCDVCAGKPAPDVYLKVAGDLEVNPSNCLVFEDITAGIMAGKNAGMRVCAVEDEYSAYQREEKKTLADYYIQDYYEVLNG